MAVNLERGEEQIPELLTTLQQLGIPTEVVRRDGKTHEAESVVLRIRPDRVEEAILALGLVGFSDVRAYDADRPHPSRPGGGSGTGQASRGTGQPLRGKHG